MTRAERKKHIKRVRAVAEQSGSRAYCFVMDGEQKVEIRVWPSGRWSQTPVDDAGAATGKPKRSLLR